MWKEITAAVRRGCEPSGLDLLQPFPVAVYNQVVPDAYWLPDFGRPRALGLLIGNTRALWPRFLAALREIESVAVEGDVAAGKMSVMKEKERRRKKLQREWGAPDPPWTKVSPNVLWNIHNTPAAQISMLGKITGLAFAPRGDILSTRPRYCTEAGGRYCRPPGWY